MLRMVVVQSLVRCSLIIIIILQVAAHAPLALLLLPEARCDHLVFTHLKYN